MLCNYVFDVPRYHNSKTNNTLSTARSSYAGVLHYGRGAVE